jgi:capsular polysaccharide biosynthesis protein
MGDYLRDVKTYKGIVTWGQIAEETVRRFESGDSFDQVGKWLSMVSRKKIAKGKRK